MNQAAGTIRGPAPKGLLRVLLRCPILLYRLHLGWLLGHRFLLLAHVGRKSGMPHFTVLEVVSYDSTKHRCVIASGWGEKAQWYKNILANPDVAVTLGTHRHRAKEAELELRDYARKYPWSMKRLNRSMLGKKFHGQDADFQKIATQVPLVELQIIDA